MQTAINSDFGQHVTLDTEQMPWLPSPQANVERRMLDRIGGEVARATSLVRYAAGSSFPAHSHGLGEEFLVLEGVFSDEHGDYSQGTYVRNHPGSQHTPFTMPGCVIFVKLRQMPAYERQRVVIDTRTRSWQAADFPGLECIGLFTSVDGERVSLERLAAGASFTVAVAGGEEILVLQGRLEIGHDTHMKGAWIRTPAGALSHLSSSEGAMYWVKRGHLARPIGVP
jgi:hypothetical protein